MFASRRLRDDAIEQQIPALRRFARSLVRDRDRADDLVQECLVRALSGWPTLRSADRLRPWLFSILYNVFLMEVRRMTGRETLPLETVALTGCQGDQELAAEAARVMRIIERLPDDHRAVLLLIAVEDMSYGEAATVLGVPTGTVMSRLSRARERLRALVGGGNLVPLRRTK